MSKTDETSPEPRAADAGEGQAPSRDDAAAVVSEPDQRQSIVRFRRALDRVDAVLAVKAVKGVPTAGVVTVAVSAELLAAWRALTPEDRALLDRRDGDTP